jgi:hypothetical protein
MPIPMHQKRSYTPSCLLLADASRDVLDQVIVYDAYKVGSGAQRALVFLLSSSQPHSKHVPAAVQAPAKQRDLDGLWQANSFFDHSQPYQDKVCRHNTGSETDPAPTHLVMHVSSWVYITFTSPYITLCIAPASLQEEVHVVPDDKTLHLLAVDSDCSGQVRASCKPLGQFGCKFGSTRSFDRDCCSAFLSSTGSATQLPAHGNHSSFVAAGMTYPVTPQVPFALPPVARGGKPAQWPGGQPGGQAPTPATAATAGAGTWGLELYLWVR